jgi:holo-ACP synthase/triphosphoribosyl-dephospho-CoA synthase
MIEEEITLPQVLAAREERVGIQNALLDKYRAPVVSFTMNMAGPVKRTALSHRAFLWGLEQLRVGFVQNRMKVLREITRELPTGDEGYFAVDAPAERVKALCVEIEEANRMGRFFDMDVIGADGNKLERGRERDCIVCHKPGRDCASRRLHTVAELQAATKAQLSWGLRDQDRRRISALATRALLEEVAVTPKPGLVDRTNNGAHRDMDLMTFQASAAALSRYWEECFLHG